MVFGGVIAAGSGVSQKREINNSRNLVTNKPTNIQNYKVG
jgi:hypothetical protein